MLQRELAFFRIGLLVTSFVVSADASAQSLEQHETDIVVTATRQETRLQDTPIAISAYSAEQMERSGVRDLRDVATFTPGLTIGTGEGQGAVPISIRGVGQNDLGIGADAPIAVYLDGVYLARTYMNLFELVDVERIEVLRGPQGSLYGRNATGGAVNVISRRPGPEVVVQGEARYGNYDAWGAQALAMGPLGGNFFGKIALATSRREGYTKEARSGADLDPEKSFAVRTALRWNPSPSLDVQLNADRGYHNMPVVVHSSLGANFDPERIELDSAPREDRDYWGVSLDAAYDLGSVKLISVTGYREARLTNVIDTDAGPTRAIQFSQFDATAQWSQELRLNSAPKTRLQWLAGIYLFQEDADTFSPIFLDFTENLGLPSPTTQTIEATNRTKAFALFGQASFKLTDQLTISGGLRWSKEQKIFTFNQQFTIDIPPLFSSYPRSRQKTRWTDVSPRIAVDYRASNNLLVYASYSDGFKSGGSTSVSLITTPVPNVFAPESLEAFEAGIKSDWFNDDLRVNITAFHYDYKDLQVRTTDAFGFLIVRNAANARVDGLELEMSAQPIRGLDLTAIAAVLDARYGEFIDPVTLADYSGTRLNRAPKLKASFGAQYAFRLESGAEFAVRGEYEHMSRLYHQPGNLTAFSRAPTHLFNGRLAYRTADRRWSIALLAKNLTNERRIGHNFVVLGEPRSTITPPRTLVLEVCFTR